MVVAIPIAMREAAIGVQSSALELQKTLDEKDPVDSDGHPIRDAQGNIVHYTPGMGVPEPTKKATEEAQNKADAGNFIAAVLDDIFDGGD
jgi:hypothetical protein